MGKGKRIDMGSRKRNIEMKKGGGGRIERGRMGGREGGREGGRKGGGREGEENDDGGTYIWRGKEEGESNLTPPPSIRKMPLPQLDVLR